MSQCLNPDCLYRNPDGSKFCQKCRSKLVLRERYRAIKVIGRGGFGRTFLAIDEDIPTKPDCVIKQFFPQEQGTGTLQKASELFEQEAMRLAHLGKHPQIPGLLDYFSHEDERQYLVQEYIPGDNLEQEIKQKGVCKEKEIRQLLGDLLPILEFVHQEKVIHRDIKPENIIRRQTDNKLFLVDFGAAKLMTPTNRSVTGTVIGSAEYVAPEQSNGKAIYASDLYSLGVTCIYLLTGISPFDLFDMSEHEWVWRQYLVNNAVSDELGNILDNLIKFATSKRYASATEVLQDLQGKRPSVNPTQHQVTPQAIVPTRQEAIPQLATFEFETVIVDQRGQIIKRQRHTASYYREVFLKKGWFNEVTIALDLVYIPGGTFMMGSPAGEGRDFEKPQHEVTILPFYISKYPITQAQWQAVASLPKINRDDIYPSPSYFKGNERPVESVTWYEAREFCDRLSQHTRKPYRLPSEAEWEYACRAGTTTPFYFGKTITTDLGNYDGKFIYASAPKGKYRQETTPVGQFPPNAFGLYDMPGNVCEWCADDYHSNYEGAPIDGSTWTSGYDHMTKILRGGSWDVNPQGCRSACRGFLYPDIRSNYGGFRLVCGVPRT